MTIEQESRPLPTDFHGTFLAQGDEGYDEARP